jgi:hypothetical protein
MAANGAKWMDSHQDPKMPRKEADTTGDFKKTKGGKKPFGNLPNKLILCIAT